MSAHQFIVAARPCSLQRAPLLAEQLTGTTRAGFHVAQVSLDMDAIAGVALFPDHGSGSRELLCCVQLALHDANTESAAMRDPVLAACNMQFLQVSGVRFAIDDFGTGYSSLSHLSRLPFDELKIDRSLIAHAHERKDDATIVTSTIELAHSMNLRVVAEGVENPESWNLLRRLGCDFAQGFLVSPPLQADHVSPFVRKANLLLQDSDNTVHQIRALEELSKLNNRR